MGAYGLRGGGQGFWDDSTRPLLLISESVKEGEGDVKNCPK